MLRRAWRKGFGRFERECNQGGSDVGDMAGAGPHSAWPSSRVADRLAAAVLGVSDLPNRCPHSSQSSRRLSTPTPWAPGESAPS